MLPKCTGDKIHLMLLVYVQVEVAMMPIILMVMIPIILIVMILIILIGAMSRLIILIMIARIISYDIDNNCNMIYHTITYHNIP